MPTSYGSRYEPDNRNAATESLPTMPFENVVKFGSLRSLPLPSDCPLDELRPPVFLPIVSPAVICQRCEKRFAAVNSTPVYFVSRYGWLSITLLCRPLNAGRRL